MTVAINVPSYQRDTPEARLYRSLTTQRAPRTSPRAVPQGLCVVTAGGKVLEWVQVFEDEDWFLAFLERNAAAFDEDPTAAGTVPVPAEHAGDCAVSPPAQRGSLQGFSAGRGLTKSGKLTKKTRESHSMQERVKVERRDVDALCTAIRAAPADGRTELSGALLVPFLDEVHMGVKDVRLFNNPVGARTTREELSLWVERDPQQPGLVRLTATTALSASKEARPSFSHEQDLTWTGFLTLDERGISSLLLVAEGTYHLDWEGGFEDGADRFSVLFAGRKVCAKRGVRFALSLVRPTGGVEAFDRPTGGIAKRPPASLRRKAQTLQSALRRYQERGGDMRRVAGPMREVQSLLKERSFAEAEKRLDAVLKIVGE